MGIRWANISGGVVYQEPQNIIQEPFDRDNSDRGGAISVVSITASADPLTILALSSSLDPSGNFNFKRRDETKLYDKIILGSGTLGNTPINPPSWTQNFIGLKHGFVVSTLSASDHESQVINPVS